MSNIPWMHAHQAAMFSQVLVHLDLEMIPLDENNWDEYQAEIAKLKTWMSFDKPGMALSLRLGDETVWIDVWRITIQDVERYLIRFWSSNGKRFDEPEFHIGKMIQR